MRFIKKIENPFLDKIMTFFSKIGDLGAIWIAISLIMLFKSNYQIYGVILIVTLFMTSVVGEFIIKNIIRRNRPFDNKILNQNTIIIDAPKSYSFPSGHTAASFATVGIFYYFGLNFILLILIVAVLISFSRIYLRVHYFTDVLAGVFLGIAISCFVYKFVCYHLIFLIKS